LHQLVLALQGQGDRVTIMTVNSDFFLSPVELGAPCYRLEAPDQEFARNSDTRTYLKAGLPARAYCEMAKIVGNEIGPVVMRTATLSSGSLEHVILDGSFDGRRNHCYASRSLPGLLALPGETIARPQASFARMP
jgi:hypothetical protein